MTAALPLPLLLPLLDVDSLPTESESCSGTLLVSRKEESRIEEKSRAHAEVFSMSSSLPSLTEHDYLILGFALFCDGYHLLS
jgi:hypothetical protein